MNPYERPSSSSSSVDESTPLLVWVLLAGVVVAAGFLGVAWVREGTPSRMLSVGEWTVVVMVVCYGWAVLALARYRGIYQEFLTRHPEIQSPSDLAAFKNLARRGMHLALAQIAALGVGLVAGLAATRIFGLAGLVAVLVANGIVAALGRTMKRHEETIRSLPVHDESLRAEYLRVGQSWVKRALPDF